MKTIEIALFATALITIGAVGASYTALESNRAPIAASYRAVENAGIFTTASYAEPEGPRNQT